MTIRVSDSEKHLLQELAHFHNMSLSEFARSALLEKAEDEFDLKCAEQAIEYNKQHPEVYTLDDLKKDLE